MHASRRLKDQNTASPEGRHSLIRSEPTFQRSRLNSEYPKPATRRGHATTPTGLRYRCAGRQDILKIRIARRQFAHVAVKLVKT